MPRRRDPLTGGDARQSVRHPTWSGRRLSESQLIHVAVEFANLHARHTVAAFTLRETGYWNDDGDAWVAAVASCEHDAAQAHAIVLTIAPTADVSRKIIDRSLDHAWDETARRGLPVPSDRRRTSQERVS